MARVLIGSYILDSADSSSTSTTSGAMLDLDAERPASPIITDTEFLWPVMYVQVGAASESALKTAVDAVVDAIEKCSGKAIVFEETSGTTLFQMHPNIWPDATGSVEIEWGQTTADIAFTMTGVRDGALADGSADEAGLRQLNWQYEITGGGIGGMVATALFGPTLSGTTVTAGARANAVAWINKLRNTANYPAWLDTNFRMVSSIVDFDQKVGQSSITESSYDPVLATLTFREIDSTLAADATWPSDIVSANWNVLMEDREPIDVRSGVADAGFDVELSGTLILKTEGNTTFNSSETKLSDATVRSTADTAVEAIITHFRAVYSNLNLTQIGGKRINIDPVQGNVGFAVTFVSYSGIMKWEERGEILNEWPKVWSRASDGSDWRYANSGGPVRTLSHELTIVSLDAPQPYRIPGLNSQWDEVTAGQQPTVEAVTSNGIKIYRTSGQTVWRYMNDGPTEIDPDEPRTRLGNIRWNAIGEGRL